MEPDYILHLNSSGNSISVTSPKGKPIPKELDAASCKTHQQVLTFLQNLSNSPLQCSFVFYHGKEEKDRSNLVTMINFVTKALDNSGNNTPSSLQKRCFCL